MRPGEHSPPFIFSPRPVKYLILDSESAATEGYEMVGLVSRVIVLSGLLWLTTTMSVLIPAQAVPRNPKGECVEVVGTDPHGVNHETAFYHNWAAKKLAATWIAQGWADVMVSPC